MLAEIIGSKRFQIAQVRSSLPRTLSVSRHPTRSSLWRGALRDKTERLRGRLSKRKRKEKKRNRAHISHSKNISHNHILCSVECPICLDTMKNPRALRCKHKFCSYCLQKALDMSNKCPVCQEPQGVLQAGNQPPGRMTVHYDSYTRIPGYRGNL